MKLIDKDALVAEIERLIEMAKAERVLHPKTILAAKNYLLIEDYNKLLSFLNTLEVKEVDLIKEAERFVQTKEFIYSTESPVIVTAKHFFELGLAVSNKAQKGK